MSDMCDDNRFDLIEKYKKKLIEATNIENAPDEMAVLDNILFRFWQVGWLDKLELPSAQPEITRCKDCKHKHVENMVWTCPFGLPGGENFFCGYGAEPYKGE